MKEFFFSHPDAFALRALGLLERAVDYVMPMTAVQRRDLPYACRDLSAMLTTERSALFRSYWASPRLTSAYLRYFFSWNIVRLTALLPALDLGPLPERPLILDLGSGPLTLPVAIWLSRPDMRARPVTIVASDTSPHVLELGKTLFAYLREKLDPESAWTVRTMRAPAALALRRLRARPGDLWLLGFANVLNEMEDRRPKDGQHISERVRSLLEDAHAMLASGGHVLCVEPGTRQGGRMTAMLRRSAMGGQDHGEDLAAMAAHEELLESMYDSSDAGAAEQDFDTPLFMPVFPCVHTGPCPMLGRGVSAWCHFNAPAPFAPEQLRTLSARAGMDKDSVSLSVMLLKKLDEPFLPEPRLCRGRIPARIVSDAFSVPGLPGAARYACTPAGLALIPGALRLRQAQLCGVLPTRERDAKSRAAIMVLEEAEDDLDRQQKHRTGGAERAEQKRGHHGAHARSRNLSGDPGEKPAALPRAKKNALPGQGR